MILKLLNKVTNSNLRVIIAILWRWLTIRLVTGSSNQFGLTMYSLVSNRWSCESRGCGKLGLGHWVYQVLSIVSDWVGDSRRVAWKKRSESVNCKVYVKSLMIKMIGRETSFRKSFQCWSSQFTCHKHQVSMSQNRLNRIDIQRFPMLWKGFQSFLLNLSPE